MQAQRKTIALVGGFDAAHIAGSFSRAAARVGFSAAKFDVSEAWTGSRLVRALRWRFADRRPPRLRQFSKHVVRACAEIRPDMLIATGFAPLTGDALRQLDDYGVACVNYATDDPWNPLSCAKWFLRALPGYRTVFTPRRANIGDLRALGCEDVRYLPFGYDEMLHSPVNWAVDQAGHDVLFVGGADRERVAFAERFVQKGPSLAVVGGYWDHFSRRSSRWLGCKTPEEIRTLTAAAKINLCLIRRANRDGHVMRSFEIAAIGGCMLVEDTEEHRDIFGADGEAVVYFRNAEEAADRASVLLRDSAERIRLARSCREKVISGANSYAERLSTIISGV